MSWLTHLLRFITASLVLLLVGFLVPGFAIHGVATAFISAAVITALGRIVEGFFGGEVSPYGRGLIGFLTTAGIIYITKFMVKGVEVTFIGALLAALIIGIIDLFLPSKVRYWSKEE